MKWCQRVRVKSKVLVWHPDGYSCRHRESLSPTETWSTLRAMARLFFHKLLLPLIQNPDRVDAGFLRVCREGKETKRKTWRNKTNQWSLLEQFLSLDESSFDCYLFFCTSCFSALLIFSGLLCHHLPFGVSFLPPSLHCFCMHTFLPHHFPSMHSITQT